MSRRGGPFGPARKVPGSEGAWTAGVVVNEDGRALIHWRIFVGESHERVHIAGLKIDGGFGKTREVMPRVGQVAIGPGGRFTLVYVPPGERFRGVYARMAPPSGKLGPPTKIATRPVAVRQVWYVGNQPYVAYTQESEGHGKLRERRIGVGGPSRVIANLPARSTLVLDTASNGVQAAVTTGTGSPLLAAVRGPGGVFKWQRLETRFAPQELDVAVARTGAATVAWGDWIEPLINDEPSPTPWPPGEMYTAYRPAGGSFGEVRAFRPDPKPSWNTDFAVEMNSRGTSILGLSKRMVIQRKGGEPEVTRIADFFKQRGRRDRRDGAHGRRRERRETGRLRDARKLRALTSLETPRRTPLQFARDSDLSRRVAFEPESGPIE